MKTDLLRVIEAAYQNGEEEHWVRGIAEAARPALDCGLGVVAYSIVRQPSGLPRFDSFVECGGMGLTKGLLEKAIHASPMDLTREMYAVSRVSTLTELLAAKRAGAALFREDLLQDVQSLGMNDSLGVFAVNAFGRGLMLHAALPAPRRLSPAFRRTWSRIVVHLDAGLRLRASADALTGDGDAVLEASGKLQHAVGPAQSKASQVSLRQAARAIDRARSTRQRDPDAAVELWRGLVEARWSLVDRFDSDGRHFLIARRNPVPSPVVRELTDAQRQVASLAAQGHSNKLVAYQLGLSVGTVATHLMRAMRKLGLRSRAQLISEWTLATRSHALSAKTPPT